MKTQSRICVAAFACITAVCCWACLGGVAGAVDFNVASTQQFSAALASAAQGDKILLQPGQYAGGYYRVGLSGVTIRSADPENRAVIRGGTTGIQLGAAQSVILEDLIFERQTDNGLNIDDHGDASTPSTNVIIRRVTLRDIGSSGNQDGVKLSGVNDFLIDQVEVFGWGNGGGSAIDMVGSHRGLIQNSYFRDEEAMGSVVQPKGGTKTITIRANRIELPNGTGRAIQAGGGTGAPFFRFVDGDSGYEAAEIIAEGNVLLGGEAAFAFVNIDGGLFHHNYAYRPNKWTVRILNENRAAGIVETKNGVVRNNAIIFNDTAAEYSRAVNVGSGTLSGTFTFSDNRWFNLANPTVAGSTPQLPVSETGGLYGPDAGGQDLGIDSDGVIAWEFDWGIWLVNASSQAANYHLDQPNEYQEATAEASASFVPSEQNPFVGQWQHTELTTQQLQLQPFSQLILRANSFEPTADANSDQRVDGTDFLAWQTGFGANPADRSLGDFTGDNAVDAADLSLWSTQYGLDNAISSISSTAASSRNAVAVVEPSGACLCVSAAIFCIRGRWLAAAKFMATR